MFLNQLDLTTALRPAYLPDEDLLFVQDHVGLYGGKFKLPNQQNGQVYLTSHRVCYVDKAEPRKYSVALSLKDVDRHEFYAGFLKSSAKVTLIPKPIKRSNLSTRISANLTGSSSGVPSSPTASGTTASATPATWICTICSFSNPVPSNFDPGLANAHTPLPPCLACGIKPTLAHVLKAAISNSSNRTQSNPSTPAISSQTSRSSQQPLEPTGGGGGQESSSSDPEARFECPRCTFLNFPSLLSCEICGASLITRDVPTSHLEPVRTDSPGPTLSSGQTTPDASQSVKISFRNGGDKIFYERLKAALTQRKWLQHGAPPIPKSSRVDGPASPGVSATGGASGKQKAAGIAALEQRGLDLRKNNEIVIGGAFEDLEALMASAKEVMALAERFSRQINGAGGAPSGAGALLAESAGQMGLIATKDIVGGGSSSESLYLSELSRNLAEYLTDDARGILKKAGGIITLVDLWAMFNRARGGVELVSPADFEKAARLWEELQLPLRLRTFKSGVLAVQGQDRTDETTIKALLSWIDDLHEFPPEKDVPWDWHAFGIGVTAQEAALRFGWSIGVAEEELEMAEEKGVLCREESIEGLKFWKNHIDTGDIAPPLSEYEQELQKVENILRNAGFI